MTKEAFSNEINVVVRQSTQLSHHKLGGQSYQPFPNPIDDLP